ncbi:hypothetical protein [Caldicoprobacter algeriensis]|nr:hypothetical protein [Caldicoprobacter algeriensis]
MLCRTMPSWPVSFVYVFSIGQAMAVVCSRSRLTRVGGFAPQMIWNTRLI